MSGLKDRQNGTVLTFVTADEASMDAFLSVSVASAFHDRLRDYAASLVQKGCTRAEWCLVGLNAGRPVVRGALWALPEHPVPTDIVLIDADWSDPDLAGGRELLNELHELARTFGADVVSHSVDAPPNAPQYQENEADRVRLLERIRVHAPPGRSALALLADVAERGRGSVARVPVTIGRRR